MRFVEINHILIKESIIILVNYELIQDTFNLNICGKIFTAIDFMVIFEVPYILFPWETIVPGWYETSLIPCNLFIRKLTLPFCDLFNHIRVRIRIFRLMIGLIAVIDIKRTIQIFMQLINGNSTSQQEVRILQIVLNETCEFCHFHSNDIDITLNVG